MPLPDCISAVEGSIFPFYKQRTKPEENTQLLDPAITNRKEKEKCSSSDFPSSRSNLNVELSQINN
jgi:hypothetical protein